MGRMPKNIVSRSNRWLPLKNVVVPSDADDERVGGCPAEPEFAVYLADFHDSGKEPDIC